MKNNGCGTGINPVLPGTTKDVNETQFKKFEFVPQGFNIQTFYFLTTR
jgi:hypothetical protein